MRLTAMRSKIADLFESTLVTPTINKVRRDGLTYLPTARLASIARLTREIIAKTEDPTLVEFGVALGGSSILMTELLSQNSKGHLFGYDMFGLIPPPSSSDGQDAHDRYGAIIAGKSIGLKGQTYYGYQSNLQKKVIASFEAYGLPEEDRFTLIAGDFRESFLKPQKTIDLMHIDCDWYDSVTFCLLQADTYLSVGGYIIVDDYGDYEGCRRAVTEFLSNAEGKFELISTEPHGIIKRIL
jgi:asparagine synthase (glutamine-hydrolysing)